MKKYSLLILSFIISIAIFFILIIIQKNIVNQDSLIKVYVLNQDIDIYTPINMAFLDEIYINNSLINSYNFITNLDDVLNKVSKQNFQKGKILMNDSLINKSDVDEIKKNSDLEKVAIKLDSISNIYSKSINNNSKLNLYITINEKNLPNNFGDYSSISQIINENILYTFMYMENINPIKFLDENGNNLENENKFSTVILNVTKQQAMYLNSIKDIAKFNVTVK